MHKEHLICTNYYQIMQSLSKLSLSEYAETSKLNNSEMLKLSFEANHFDVFSKYSIKLEQHIRNIVQKLAAHVLNNRGIAKRKQSRTWCIRTVSFSCMVIKTQMLNHGRNDLCVIMSNIPNTTYVSI